MTTRPVGCVAEEDLGDTLALPESDPRRTHLETCPRCRALVVSYRQFLEPGGDESNAYGTSEARALDRFRERLTGEAPAAAAAAPSASRGREPRDRESWWSKLFAPPLRPAWGVLAVLVVIAGVWIGPRLAPPEPTSALRGNPEAVLTLSEPVRRADGGVNLEWHAVPDADRYELRFFSTDLVEIGRRDLGDTTRVDLLNSDLPQTYHAGNIVLYRIVALKGGDEIEASSPGSLQKP